MLEDLDAIPYRRKGAIRVLASMPMIAELSVPRLETRLARETTDNMRGSIVFALGEIGASTPLQKVLAESKFSATKCMAVSPDWYLADLLKEHDF